MIEFTMKMRPAVIQIKILTNNQKSVYEEGGLPYSHSRLTGEVAEWLKALPC